MHVLGATKSIAWMGRTSSFYLYVWKSGCIVVTSWHLKKKKNLQQQKKPQCFIELCKAAKHTGQHDATTTTLHCRTGFLSLMVFCQTYYKKFPCGLMRCLLSLQHVFWLIPIKISSSLLLFHKAQHCRASGLGLFCGKLLESELWITPAPSSFSCPSSLTDCCRMTFSKQTHDCAVFFQIFSQMERCGTGCLGIQNLWSSWCHLFRYMLSNKLWSLPCTGVFMMSSHCVQMDSSQQFRLLKVAQLFSSSL